MNTHAEKTQENKSQSVSHGVSQIQSGSKSTFQFIDNRPEASAQRSLQEMVNKSAQVKKAAQLQAMANNYSAQQQHPIQKKASPEHSDKPNVPDGRKKNNTGLPDNLKLGIENLSGYSMDDVKVHRNSDKPAQLNAHAYAQGTDIHLASGQEKHLPHEAWHVVQQKQGRVKGTTQLKGTQINDDSSLEKEADVMGSKAMQLKEQGEADRAAYNSVGQKKSNVEQGFSFVDNRPEALQQRKHQNLSGNNILQGFFYPPIPPQGLEWNTLLNNIGTLHASVPLPNKADIDNYIVQCEGNWYGDGDHNASVVRFNAFITLKGKVRSGLNQLEMMQIHTTGETLQQDLQI